MKKIALLVLFFTSSLRANTDWKDEVCNRFNLVRTNMKSSWALVDNLTYDNISRQSDGTVPEHSKRYRVFIRPGNSAYWLGALHGLVDSTANCPGEETVCPKFREKFNAAFEEVRFMGSVDGQDQINIASGSMPIEKVDALMKKQDDAFLTADEILFHLYREECN